MSKPILCLDFDGVIHSYTSGWQGAAVINDTPVDGALEFIVAALEKFEVHIFSSRSHQWGGRAAMKRWLRSAYSNLGKLELVNGYYELRELPDWWFNRVAAHTFADPFFEQHLWEAREVVRQIKWPLFKPAAMISIDDRALTFTGKWPALDELASFKPWNKKPAPAPTPEKKRGKASTAKTSARRKEKA